MQCKRVKLLDSLKIFETSVPQSLEIPNKKRNCLEVVMAEVPMQATSSSTGDNTVGTANNSINVYVLYI